MAIEQVNDEIWPIGSNSPLLLLPMDPGELSERFGLVFENAVDDLGDLQIAVVSSQKFGFAGLIRYLDAPFEGTTVFVDAEADLRYIRDAVLSEFGLVESGVSWITTDLRPGVADV